MNPSRRPMAVVCCCLAVAGLLAGAGAAAVVSEQPIAATDADRATERTDESAALTAQEDKPWAALQGDIDADSVELVVDVGENGNAQWQVRYRLRLESDADRQAFQELEADVETNESKYLGPFEERITNSVETASAATGREMSARAFAVTTDREEQPQVEYGLVVFSYEWLGFAVADSDGIRLGDAVEGLFLDEDEQIEFRWPAAYRLDSSSPEPDVVEDDRAVYRGRFNFDTGQPELVVTSADEGSSLLWLLAVAVGLVGVAAVTGLYWRRRRADAGEATPAEAPTSPAGGGAAASETTGADEQAAAKGDQGPPPELLSNEERLLQLLDQNGGRMKQKAVAEQLDWSAAKTSQVVGDLREADEIESFRLGRENVLTLPHVDIDESIPDDNGDTDA